MSNIRDDYREAIEKIVFPMVGPRCKTKDKHDFPDLDLEAENARCLVCTTYEEVDKALDQLLAINKRRGFLLVNVGCHECGVGHEMVGIYKTRKQAEKVAEKQEYWRDGGQSVPEIFNLDLAEKELT